jgi:hypothetical protein
MAIENTNVRGKKFDAAWAKVHPSRAVERKLGCQKPLYFNDLRGVVLIDRVVLKLR